MASHKLPTADEVAAGWRRCMGCGGTGHLWNIHTKTTALYVKPPAGPILVEPCESHAPRTKVKMQ
jgi:hypothetical protein